MTVKLETLRSGPHIGSKEEANEHEVYNEFIFKGYRINYKTWRDTLLSFFAFHNESINVWTHSFGFIAAIVTLFVIGFSKVGELMQAGTQEVWSGFTEGFLEQQ